MKIAVFANSRMAGPTLAVLLHHRLVAGLCLPNRDLDVLLQLERLAQSYGVPVLRIDKEDVGAVCPQWLAGIQANCAFVLTFPFVLPATLLDSLPQGVYNFHFAALPGYRGAEPLFWQIKNEEPEGAICIHKMTDQLDAGPIAMHVPVPIVAGDTHGMQISRLAQAAPSAAMEFVQQLQQGQVTLTPQNEGAAHYVRKPGFEDVVIHWQTMTASQIDALVRACNPWNRGALAQILGMEVRIAAVSDPAGRKLHIPAGAPAGTVVSDKKGSVLAVTCADGKQLLLDIVCIEEGIVPGTTLFEMGISPGQQFG